MLFTLTRPLIREPFGLKIWMVIPLWMRGHVRVYNISWNLNHQHQLLIDLVPWYGISSHVTRGHSLKLTQPSNSSENILHQIWEESFYIYISSPKSACVRKHVRLYNIFWGFNHQHKLLVKLLIISFKS